jgi:hypothetical protein
MPRASTTTAPKRTPRAPAWDEEVLRLDPRQIALARRISTTRPQPPASVADDEPERFEPAAAFADWIRETFIAADGPLSNPHHEHLLDARLGVLWTNAIHVRQMRSILATAEIPQTMGGAWKRGRAEQQLRDWFHCEPDFVLTFYGPEVATLDDRSFCALIEHELYHCAQAKDEFGGPKFHRETGAPIYAIRGHDVEEFTPVVERYGPTSSAVQDIVDAANSTPLLGDGPIDIACGTCRRAAA